MKIMSVVGARPNFMKIAPFIRAIESYKQKSTAMIDHVLVHTGQHYDDKMSKAFFNALDMPAADINLGIGSGSHAQQVGQTMMAFEKVIGSEKPAWVVLVGDVNATLACAVTAKKEWVRCCHIEAGLRSGDMTMPEEINRLVTDRLSDLLLTPDELSSENLRKEGVADDKIRFVGNIMIDTLEANRAKAKQLSLETILRENSICGQPQVAAGSTYAVTTLHRPNNVDYHETLEPVIDFLIHEVATDIPVFWPVHPRTMQRIKDFGLWDRAIETPNLVLIHPLGYQEMLRLNMGARIMFTDSGGIQEECTVLGTPCLTLRWNTERPVTLVENGGTSVLVGNNIFRLRKEYRKILSSKIRPVRPEFWDGMTAIRCLQAILDYNDHKKNIDNAAR